MDREVLAKVSTEPGPFALVTIVEVRGSAPRHPGSSMLVAPYGSILGTIGGGTGEAKAVEAGLVSIRSQSSSLLEVEMLGSEAEGKDMICGGLNRMLVEFVSDPSPYAAAFEALSSGKRVLLVRDLSSLSRGTVRLEALDEALSPLGGSSGPSPADGSLRSMAAKAFGSGEAALIEGESLFLDPLLPREKLFILGGGHVGLALAKAAEDLDWDITVVDDRPEFADQRRFGPRTKVRLGSYEAEIDAFPFDYATYAVVLSRGHLFDLECARAILRREYRYVGLIGSRRKVSLLREQLAKDGYPEAKIASLHAPIGLDIGAETPAEIAVSILAEMISVRRKTG